ncbi:ABC transporter substrate-binding protein [Pelagibacterium lentulum]|uniref:Lipoprotein n=1 Tax=Pelagibacterium lentulum TaxID=2029865 RepID=A0A916RL75_9HYPH|nr:ABC transporter substrate-binding protein [Pelagibacterium lentulum]GGA58032.1 lipoprotein [Pelagibacterium lentulum]
MTMRKLALAFSLSLFATGAMAQNLTIESCDSVSTLDAVPSRAITLNQQATEVMLALGLEDHMIGTAYIDDAIPEQWLEAYNSVPVLAERFPAREVVLAEDPDFLFAGFASAFNDRNLGAESEWHDIGVATYLVHAECRNLHPADVRMTTDSIFIDIERIAALFGVEAEGEAIAADIETRLAAAGRPGEGLKAFLYDSGTDTAFSAGCCGAPGLLLETAGFENIGADVEGRWADLAWEAVVTAEPDVIILIEAEWSTAEDKRNHLLNDPVLSELEAVREERFIVVPFSETLLGLRFVDGVERLAAALSEGN